MLRRLQVRLTFQEYACRADCRPVNKKRLYKSADAVIGGVCGGIAEYFGIDATLVRIIAVALLIVFWGVPVIPYLILMIALPVDPSVAQGYVNARVETTAHSQDEQAPLDVPAGRPSPGFSPSDQPPPPDPASRVSAQACPPPCEDPYRATWNTVSASAEHTTKSHTSAVLVVGAVLIGIGVITLLSNFVHISLWRFWPMVVIVVGLVCLFTPGHQGWSLERAGNSIVLISIGLALLAWTLQIVRTRVFFEAFFDLWPLLLVVAGLAVIGGARKSSIVMLGSSLVLSATIIVGLWFYGGLDWASFSTNALLSSEEGLHDFFLNIAYK